MSYSLNSPVYRVLLYGTIIGIINGDNRYLGYGSHSLHSQLELQSLAVVTAVPMRFSVPRCLRRLLGLGL